MIILYLGNFVYRGACPTATMEGWSGIL